MYNSSLAWGDYDNDGHLDLVFWETPDGIASHSITRIAQNNGDSSFT